MNGGDHLVCPTHLNRAHSGLREAVGTCKICVSARGMNLFLVSHIVGQCLMFLYYYSFVVLKNQERNFRNKKKSCGLLIQRSLQCADGFSRLLPYNRAQPHKREVSEMNVDPCFLKYPAQNHETSETCIFSNRMKRVGNKNNEGTCPKNDCHYRT